MFNIPTARNSPDWDRPVVRSGVAPAVPGAQDWAKRALAVRVAERVAHPSGQSWTEDLRCRLLALREAENIARLVDRDRVLCAYLACGHGVGVLGVAAWGRLAELRRDAFDRRLAELEAR